MRNSAEVRLKPDATDVLQNAGSPGPEKVKREKRKQRRTEKQLYSGRNIDRRYKRFDDARNDEQRDNAHQEADGSARRPHE